MFKKVLLPLLIILVFSLNGCISQNPKYINFTSKPSNHYYTDELKNKVLNNENFSLSVFDTNLYKDIKVNKDETIIIDSFLNSITEADYLPYESKPQSKEAFRLIVSFNDDTKFLIRIYDSSIIAVSPWDGNFEEDIISMSSLPLHYNLMDFCTHIQNKPVSKNWYKCIYTSYLLTYTKSKNK